MTEELRITLEDEREKDTKRFLKLFDISRWDRLIAEVNEGKKTLAELAKELLEDN